MHTNIHLHILSKGYAYKHTHTHPSISLAFEISKHTIHFIRLQLKIFLAWIRLTRLWQVCSYNCSHLTVCYAVLWVRGALFGTFSMWSVARLGTWATAGSADITVMAKYSWNFVFLHKALPLMGFYLHVFFS